MTSSSPFKYPTARRDDTVVDDFHGTKVYDPYRWLENPDSDETVKFVTEQNALTLPYLDTPLKESFRARMTELFDFPKYGCPFKRGTNYFYYYNTGMQNHSVLYTQTSLQDEPKELLDPNKMSEDGTVALGSSSVSDDGLNIAYAVSAAGSDWMTVKARRVADLFDYADELKWVKFSCLSWTKDNKGFFYNRYDDGFKMASKEAGTETDINLNQRLYYHVLGTDQSQDVLCFESPENPKWMAHIEVTDDGKYFVLNISEGCEPVNRLYIAHAAPVTGIIPFIKVIDNFEAQYEYLCNDGPVFSFKTNLKAPRYRLVRADVFAPELTWTCVLAEAADVLEWAAPVNTNQLITAYLRDVKIVLELRDLASAALLTTFPLDIGHIAGYSGRRCDSEIFFKFISFLTPGTVYHCDLTQPEIKPTEYKRAELKGFKYEDFRTQQVFYPSKDGTRIPMFIVCRKDIVLDGNNPTLLYGYGGFDISVTPSFNVSRLIFCRHMGGVLAVANLRGGGEYGETWHKAGSLGQKQNVFDDFHAAAEYLIGEKYTSSKRLVINGGSNGGLLVGACINQRPELYGCAVASVGVMDMLRFHKFTIGHAWTTDYGCADKPEEFEWLIKYSPLHNVRVNDKSQYPALLLMTGDHDDRVVPLHSLKLIATLQHVLGSDPKQTNPLFARIDVRSGHGAGKPTKKAIEETADYYAFIARSLCVEWIE